MRVERAGVIVERLRHGRDVRCRVVLNALHAQGEERDDGVDAARDGGQRDEDVKAGQGRPRRKYEGGRRLGVCCTL